MPLLFPSLPCILDKNKRVNFSSFWEEIII
jgi:hypothetical protein